MVEVRKSDFPCGDDIHPVKNSTEEYRKILSLVRLYESENNTRGREDEKGEKGEKCGENGEDGEDGEDGIDEEEEEGEAKKAERVEEAGADLPHAGLKNPKEGLCEANKAV